MRSTLFDVHPRRSLSRAMRCLRRHHPFIESLESRLLLTGTLLTLETTSYSPNINPNSVATGSTVNAAISIAPDHAHNATNPTLTGTFTIKWYNGAVIATFPVSAGARNGGNITLNIADAGQAVDAGPFKGDFILESIYSGDANYAPMRSFNQIDYADLEDGGAHFPNGATVVKFTAPPQTLGILAKPSDVTFDEVMKPPVKIAILDDQGNVNTKANSIITVSIASSTAPEPTLNGTLSMPTIKGVATFSDLSFDKSGDYTLTFTDSTGDTINSALFTVTMGKLVFLKIPKQASVENPVNPPIVVELQDAQGKVIDDDGTVVTLTPIALNHDNPQVTGNTAVLVHGVATFNNFIFKNADSYTLHATDDENDADVVSTRFKVLGDHLAFLKPIADTTVGLPVLFTVEILDAQNHLVTSDNPTFASLTLTQTDIGVPVPLVDPPVIQFVGGKAAFDAGVNYRLKQTGTFTLEASETDGSGTLFDTGTATSNDFRILNKHLVFTKAPVDSGAGVLIPISVEIVDAKKKVVTTDDNDSVQLTIVPVGQSPTPQITGTFEALHPVHGFATFVGQTTFGITTLGAYLITATVLDENDQLLVSTQFVNSDAFFIKPNHLLFKKSPSNGVANEPFSLTIQLLDFKNKLIATGAGNSDAVKFSLNIVSSGSGAVLSGSPTVGFLDGSVIFPSFGTAFAPSVNVSGVYTLTVSEVTENGIAVDTTLAATSKQFILIPPKTHVRFPHK